MGHLKHSLSLKSSTYRIYIFKPGNIKFPVETGRWLNIPRQNRKCNLRNTDSIGNEFHYLFVNILKLLYFTEVKFRAIINQNVQNVMTM